MYRRLKRVLGLAGCFLAGVAGPATAQFSIEAASINAAGGVSRGGGFEVISNVSGLSPVGRLTGGDFTAEGGFVAVAASFGRGPEIVHAPVDLVAQGQAIPIQIQVTSDAGIDEARLFYRTGNMASFVSTALTTTGDGFEGTIPATAVTSAGLAYYLTVVEKDGDARRVPAQGYYSTRVTVGDPGITSEDVLAGGETVEAYQLVSVPLELTDRAAASVFGDDLGPYDNTRWRLFGLSFDQSYAENPTNTEPGRGYWLIARDEGKIVDTGAGRTVSVAEPFHMALHPRWNLIGNPYNFDLPVGALSFKSGQAFELRTYELRWNDPVNERVDRIVPFRGYAVYNGLQAVDTLFVDPFAGEASKEGAGKRPENRYLAADWMVRIVAQTRHAVDSDNLAAVAPEATSGLDVFDWPDPPVIGNYVAAYFLPDGPIDGAVKLCVDVRPPADQGEAWTFAVRTNETGPVTLRFDEVESVPAEYDVRLVDEFTGLVQDLRSDDRYAMVGLEPGEVRTLRLVVGSPEFADQHGELPPPITAPLELAPAAPNPFVSSTGLRYGLSEPGHVSVEVFDLLGARMATLVEQDVTAGYHTVVWDGSTTAGTPAASGVYLIRVTAGAHTSTRKVVLVR